MKNTIHVLFILALVSLIHHHTQAQQSNGVYLTAHDYETHHLAYTITTADKLYLNDFLGGAHITIYNNGHKTVWSKSSIFGYRLNGHDYRFASNKSYQIMDTTGFVLYTRTQLSQQGKGYKPVEQYYYSVDSKQPIISLTLDNLSNSFVNQTALSYAIQNTFRTDNELSSFDTAHHQYKIKYIYQQQKAMLASHCFKL